MLDIYGFINREHLQRKFGISVPQASLDLQTFQREHPRTMTYDLTRKCYVHPERSTLDVRGTTDGKVTIATRHART